jgi:hypothetical protein
MVRLIGGAVAGAALMYFLDPDQGRRRRALVRDQLVSAAHATGDAADTTSRDLGNRARGLVADLRGRFRHEEVSDDIVAGRVRARLGAVVSYASAVRTDVGNGRVTLTGPVLAEDVDRLVRRIGTVRGVREVDNRLDVHAEPGNVPALQGARGRRPRGGEVFELMQRSWSPAARFITGLGGGALTAWGLRRLDSPGIVAAVLGITLLARGASNVPMRRLAGLDTSASASRSPGGWRTAP